MASRADDAGPVPGTASVSHWSAAYVGLSWQEVGPELCWGLVRKVLAERAGVEVERYEPSHLGVSDDPGTIAALLRDEPARWPWEPVALGSEQELDVVVFKRGGVEAHVGVVVAPGRMIHLSQGYDARIERFDTGKWRLRLACAYRHQDLLAPHDA